MITRLVLLNSDIYSKADIELKDADAIQLIGPNNIGKSTLIYALNFLFIVDGKRMIFSGQRNGDKSTIHHYFPTHNKSFLIFEIFKNRYYCILIKRTVDGDLEYYKIENEYKEALFINQDNQRLYSLQEIESNHITNKIDFDKFKDKREVFNFIYKSGKSNNAAVWLDSNVKTDGLSNNFSKIYKYLIYSKDIDNTVLKDSLIVADKKEKDKIIFTKQSQNEINRLLNFNNEIKAIRSVEKDFNVFKELVNQYKATNTILAKLVYNFNDKYKIVFNDIHKKTQEKEILKKQYYVELNENLKPKKDTLLQKKGSVKTNLERDKEDFDKLEGKKTAILSIGDSKTIPFFQQSIENLDTKRKQIETKISQIETQGLSKQDIENKVKKLTENLENIKEKIDNYKNLLIHQISKDKKTKELINSVFSDNLTSLSKDYIEKEIEQISEIMQIFDGAIKIPDNIKTKPIESIEELKESVEQLQKELKANNDLLPIAEKFEKNKEELIKIKKEISDYQSKIDKINSLPNLIKEIGIISKRITNNQQEFDELEKEIIKIGGKIKELDGKHSDIIGDIKDLNDRRKEIVDWKLEIEEIGIVEIENETSDSLNNIYADFNRFFKDRNSYKIEKDKLFERLKYKTNSVEANEEKLIEYIESELATINKKEKSINDLLRSISSLYSAQAKSLLSSYDEFYSWIINQFNSKLRKIKISDIDSLKIELIQNETLKKDLNKIMEIQGLDYNQILFDQTDNLNVLKKYLENGITINFSDLFDIKLHLENKGKKKAVDLKNQIESDGTDKMIRLVIIMAIINKLTINSKDNKIVIFIDELGTIDDENRIELLKFCKDNNFLPISAALHPYDGFDKYYKIFRSQGKIIVSAKNGNAMYRRKMK
mgnify:CR=1 FL=1